ncbi:MAG: hypothetical protein IPP07_22310 [Holophagales bacterium]|nr:hypothetical protein [Holophagales bacterium]
MDDGKVERIAEIKGPLGFFVTSLAWDPGSKTLFYTTDNADHRDVRSLDPRTGESTTLLPEARIGELVFNRADGSLWGVRTLNGIATLVRIPAPYSEWKQVRSWPYGESLYDMDLSPDGTLLSFSVSAVTGQHTLQVMRTEALLAGDATPVATTDFGAAIPMNFVFAPDGKTLTGSSFYTGVANLFRWNPATREKEALSNTETGFFRPLPMPDGSLLAFRFTGEGFVPARVEARVTQDVSPITFLGNETIVKHPVLEEWKVPPPSAVDLEPLVKSRGTYRSFAGIGLDSIYPVLQGYKDSASVGVRLNFSDPVQLNKLNVTAAYSPDGSLPSDERFHADARYERYDWSARVRWNAGDFYDLFGPTKTSMKGYSFRVGYQKALLYDKPRELRVEASATYYGGLDRLPDFQNIATAYDTLFAIRARLKYKNERHSLGWVDEEKGHAWDIGFAGDRVNGKSYPKFWGTYDVGVPLPIRHSSVWLRSTAGWTPRVTNEPFASFYFGGFGNNWADDRPEKQSGEFLSFPGVEIDEIAGSNFGARDARVEPPAAPLPRGRDLERLRLLDAAGALRERHGHERGLRQRPPHRLRAARRRERRRAARLPHLRPLPPRADALGGAGLRVRGRTGHARRDDGLPEDPEVAAPERHLPRRNGRSRLRAYAGDGVTTRPRTARKRNVSSTS